MSLRSQAHADLAEIFGDTEDGFDEITITSPAGVSVTFQSPTNDIHLLIDPGTGMSVSGRQASASVMISDLIAAGFGDIRGIPDKTSKPWVVSSTDVNGVTSAFKVAESNPDRGAGLMVLLLEVYSI